MKKGHVYFIERSIYPVPNSIGMMWYYDIQMYQFEVGNETFNLCQYDPNNDKDLRDGDLWFLFQRKGNRCTITNEYLKDRTNEQLVADLKGQYGSTKRK